MRLTFRAFVQQKWWLPENMFIFAGNYLPRLPTQSYCTSNTNPGNPFSKLRSKYGFKLPTPLKPVENPDPQEPNKPPSSLEGVENPDPQEPNKPPCSLEEVENSDPQPRKEPKPPYKPPYSLEGVENPDPQPLKYPFRQKPKPPYKPPSSLEGVKPYHSYLPFDFRFSYTESSSKVRPIGLREPKFSPFGPNRLDRVWTGVCAPAIDPKEGCVGSEKELENKRRLIREKIQGEPLTKAERKVLVESCSWRKTEKKITLGRDGLTHNTLNDIHNHWIRSEAVRIKCIGVCTVDMKNICTQLKDKAFGQIICRHGGNLVLYRGRNYHPWKRPRIPLMMWKPHEPVYPKLIKTTIDGLSIEETKQLRVRGISVPALIKLEKHGYFGHLVPMVRDAFVVEELVRIDCQGLERSDRKKIGCKLKELVPCILVTFAKEQIVLWKGKEYTPIHDGFFLSERELSDDDDGFDSDEDRDEGRRYFDSDDDGLQFHKPKEDRGEGRRYFDSDDDGLQFHKPKEDRGEGQRYFDSVDVGLQFHKPEEDLGEGRRNFDSDDDALQFHIPKEDRGTGRRRRWRYVGPDDDGLQFPDKPKGEGRRMRLLRLARLYVDADDDGLEFPDKNDKPKGEGRRYFHSDDE